LKSLGLKDHASPLGHNATHLVETTTLLQKKGKYLVAKFDALGVIDGLVGCSYVTFQLVNSMFLQPLP
jgi:hypothetical protein